MNEKQKILIIENDRTLATALRDTLTAQNYEVTVTASGEEGLKTAKQEQPNLIILDLMLEQLTGIDVLREIRKDKEWGSEVKIIVLSGLTYLTNMKEVKKLSTRFVPKSDFKMESLTDLIKNQLA